MATLSSAGLIDLRCAFRQLLFNAASLISSHALALSLLCARHKSQTHVAEWRLRFRLARGAVLGFSGLLEPWSAA